LSMIVLFPSKKWWVLYIVGNWKKRHFYFIWLRIRNGSNGCRKYFGIYGGRALMPMNDWKHLIRLIS